MRNIGRAGSAIGTGIFLEGPGFGLWSAPQGTDDRLVPETLRIESRCRCSRWAYLPVGGLLWQPTGTSGGEELLLAQSLHVGSQLFCVCLADTLSGESV